MSDKVIWHYFRSDYDSLEDALSDPESICWKVNCPEWCDEENAAEAAAEDFHDNCDGWESRWPLTFGLIKSGEFAGWFEVDREAVPSFTASKVEEPE